MNFYRIKDLIKETYSKENRLNSRDFLVDIGYPEKFVNNLNQKEILNSYPVVFPFKNINLERKRILDIGCGSGLDAKFCIENGADFVVGIDIHAKGEAFKNKKFLRIIGDIEQSISFKFSYFDLIVFNGSFNQIIKKFSVLKKIRNLLKENGIVIICDLLWIDDISKKDIYKKDLHSWVFNIGGSLTESEFLNIVNLTRFKVVKFEKIEKVFPVERMRTVLRR